MEPDVVATTATTIITTTSTSPPGLPGSTTTRFVTPSSTDTRDIDTGDIEGFDLIAIELNGRELLVALADDSTSRAQGLMGVTSFGEVDAMLFAWEIPTSGSFWMWTVPIPLDVAFFDGAGVLLEVITMAPCVEGVSADCPRYTPDSSYRFALEDYGGELSDLPAGSTLTVPLSSLFQP